MKPQARPFTVEIKRTKRPVHSRFSLTAASTLRPGDRPLRKLGASDKSPDDASLEAAPKAAVSEADRVFGRSATSVPVATPILDATDLPNRPYPLAQADVAAATPNHDAEGSGSEKPRQGRILPDLLSAAREEERARQAQTLSGARRSPRKLRTPSLPETEQLEAVQPEKPVRSRLYRKARFGVGRGRHDVLPRPKAAAFMTAQDAPAAVDVDQELALAKQSSAGRGNAGGRLRRKGKREGELIPLRAGERWKRRLPLVCR